MSALPLTPDPFVLKLRPSQQKSLVWGTQSGIIMKSVILLQLGLDALSPFLFLLLPPSQARETFTCVILKKLFIICFYFLYMCVWASCMSLCMQCPAGIRFSEPGLPTVSLHVCAGIKPWCGRAAPALTCCALSSFLLSTRRASLQPSHSALTRMPHAATFEVFRHLVICTKEDKQLDQYQRDWCVLIGKGA